MVLTKLEELKKIGNEKIFAVKWWDVQIKCSPYKWDGLIPHHGASVSKSMRSTGISLTTLQFSSVFKELIKNEELIIQST